jgi:hypothetical protein
VTEYLEAAFARRKSPNKLKVTMIIGAKPWLANTQHVLYEAGKKAVKRGRLDRYSSPAAGWTTAEISPSRVSRA